MGDDGLKSPVRGIRVLTEFLREIPVGFAQVMLQPSSFVGLAFIAAAYWNSWIIASVGVLGCAIGSLAARLLAVPPEQRRAGLFGFNGALVGLACAYFYPVTPLLCVVVAVGGAASTGIMHYMRTIGIRPLTFPFVVITWIIFAVLTASGHGAIEADAATQTETIVVADALLRGVGQVLFQESVLTGLVFLVAIFVRKPIEGGYALFAVCLGLAAAVLFDFPVPATNLGLYGYNGVLCAVLFAGPRFRDFASAAAAIVLSIVVVRTFHVAGLPAFTFPFVLSSWIVLWTTTHWMRRSTSANRS